MKKIILSIVFILSGSNSWAQLSNAQILTLSTIKIETQGDTVLKGVKQPLNSTATAFVFAYFFKKDTVKVLVTNNHVIKSCNKASLKFLLLGPDNLPSYGNIRDIKIDSIQSKFIKHPILDIAILPLNKIVSDYEKTNKVVIVYGNIGENLIPKDNDKPYIDFIENIFMIGYPKGVYDSKNYSPIVRKGITATPFWLNFNERKEFLADIPVFQGSSGSPIVIFEKASFSSADGGSFSYGNDKIYFLGICSQAYTFKEEQTLKVKEEEIKSQSQVYLNLSVVIKSEALLDLKDQLRKRLDIKE